MNQTDNMSEAGCVLCVSPGGEVLWEDGFARVVLASEADHPGFCRVILNAHCKEMTDLAPAQRARLMEVVFGTEAILRELLTPQKINLASLGNAVPHLHWHVIPRFADDPQYPNPVWGARVREHARALPGGFVASLRRQLRERLGAQI